MTYGLAGQIVGESAYVFVIKADKPGVSPKNAAVKQALTSIKIAGKEEFDQASIEGYDDLEALVQKQVDSLAASVSVAVVHQGEIVYTYVFCQADPIVGIPTDTQTIYCYSSMTKPFTATSQMDAAHAWHGGKLDRSYLDC